MSKRIIDDTAMIVGCQPIRGNNKQLGLKCLNPQIIISRETSKKPGGLIRVLFETRSDFAKLSVPTPRRPDADFWQRALLVTVEQMNPNDGTVFGKVLPLFIARHVDLTRPDLADAIYFALSEKEKITAGVTITDYELDVARTKVRQLVVG